MALQTRNVVLKILAGESETQKKFFGRTIFHSAGVAHLALQKRSARVRRRTLGSRRLIPHNVGAMSKWAGAQTPEEFVEKCLTFI